MVSNNRLAPAQGTIDVVYEDGVFHCTLPAGAGEPDHVQWTLHRGDFNERRSTSPVEGGTDWRVELPNMTNGFAVRAEADGELYQSRWVQHFSKETVQRYEEWRASQEMNPGNTPDQISLFRYEEPFSNIAFVCHDDQDLTGNLASLATANDLTLENHPGIHSKTLSVLSKNGSAIDSEGTHYAFSGITRSPDELLFGADDVLKSVQNISDIRDSIGEFHLLTWNEHTISFSNDYIGQGHLFYYKSDSIFAAANGLHLLALVLRTIGVELTLNEAVIKSKFFSTTYPFEFHHGPRTDFTEISRVSVYESLEIDHSGARLAKTELWNDGMDGEFSEERYEQLLSQAAADIVDNVRVAIEHPRFEHVVVELSAGLDSRIIYSALTNLPRSDRVRIATRKNPEETTAAAINNIYNFRWDDLPRTYSYPASSGASELPMSSHSVFMDGYYIDPMFRARQSYKDPVLLLSGHGGEAFSRVMSVSGYFARDLGGELPGSYENVEEVLQDLFRWVGNHQVWFSAGEEHFGDILKESLDATPSQEFAKKFEDLYVSERNPFVSGSVFRGAMAAPQWRPLHSKALFRLRSLWFQENQDYRLQFDLIRHLNPLVSEVPYTQPVEIARQQEFEKYRAPFALAAPIEFDYDSSDLMTARERVDSESTWLPSKDEFNATTSTIRRYQQSADSFLEPLGVIMDRAPELRDMGLPLFSYVDRVVNRTTNRGFPKRHNIRNKLHILMQEVLLVTEERPGQP